MVVILITVLAQNNMPSKCFITFLNTTAQTERSDSNHSLQSPCLRSSQTSLLRRKVAKLARHELRRRGNRRIIEKLGNVVSLQTSKQSSQKFKSPTEETPARGLPTTLRALNHRNFQLFFGGQLVSLIGTWMQSVAQSWLVYRLTGSSLLLGSVGFASQIPVFLASPLGGMVADRYNRQRVVIGTQIASMVLASILAVLTLTHAVTVPEI